MGCSGKIQISVDEAISVIKKTSLPTVVIEGADDVIVYRKLEDIGDGFVSLLPVGGRDNVLSIFNRKSEFLGKKVAFVADRDVWVINGIPPNYVSNDLIFTLGYSVENDVFLDVDVIGLMNKAEKNNFNNELEKFTKWFALALNRLLKGEQSEIKNHPNNLLDSTHEFERLSRLNGGEIFPQNLYEDIFSNYTIKIRGKSLMALATRQLSYKGRPAKHNHQNIMEHASSRPGNLVRRIFLDVEKIIL